MLSCKLLVCSELVVHDSLGLFSVHDFVYFCLARAPLLLQTVLRLLEGAQVLERDVVTLKI